MISIEFFCENTAKCGPVSKFLAASAWSVASTTIYPVIRFVVSEMPFVSTRLALPRGAP